MRFILLDNLATLQRERVTGVQQNCARVRRQPQVINLIFLNNTYKRNILKRKGEIGSFGIRASEKQHPMNGKDFSIGQL